MEGIFGPVHMAGKAAVAAPAVLIGSLLQGKSGFLFVMAGKAGG
jgi:hypothetical protein